jgi:hypothetical protein
MGWQRPVFLHYYLSPARRHLLARHKMMANRQLTAAGWKIGGSSNSCIAIDRSPRGPVA